MNKQQGFALIELIAVIILVGIIATFATFFLYTGFNGYVNAKTTTEGALNAQVALDRISMELRSISELTTTPSSTSLSYKSKDPAETRTLKYENQKVIINVNDIDYTLLEDIPSFTISKPAPVDLDNDGLNEIPYIEVEFRVGSNGNGIGKPFRTRIFPRHMVKDR